MTTWHPSLPMQFLVKWKTVIKVLSSCCLDDDMKIVWSHLRLVCSFPGTFLSFASAAIRLLQWLLLCSYRYFESHSLGCWNLFWWKLSCVKTRGKRKKFKIQAIKYHFYKTITSPVYTLLWKIRAPWRSQKQI